MRLRMLIVLGLLVAGPALTGPASAQTSPFQPVPAQPGQPQVKFPSREVPSPPEVGPLTEDGPAATGSIRGIPGASGPVYPYGEPAAKGGPPAAGP